MDSVGEAVSLLTKVSADTRNLIMTLSKRVDKIESSSKVEKKEKRVKEKATPVVVEDYGKKAERDLNRILGLKSIEKDKALEAEKNKNGNLLKLLGLAGAAALALKFLFDGEGFTGLVQGFQKAVSYVDDFAKGVKGNIDNIVKKVGTFTDDVVKGAKNVIDDIGKAVGPVIDDVIGGIKNSFDNVAAKMTKFGDNIVSGINQVIGKVKNAAGFADDGAKAVTKAISPGGGGGGSSPKGGGGGGGKTPAPAAAPKPAAMPDAAGVDFEDAAKGNKKGGKAMERITKFIGKMKPLKLLMKLLKNPLLAPILESFFTMGDVKGYLKEFSEGEIDEKQLNQKTGERLIKAVGGVLGGAGGAILGSIGGSIIPVVGNILGAIVGGVLGDVAGRWIGGLIAPVLGDKVGELGEFALGSPLFKLPEVTEIEDGIITKQGDVIQPDAMDTLYAMKEGGPLGGMLNKTPDILENIKRVEIDSMVLLKENNELLRRMLEKLGNNGNTVVNNSTSNSVMQSDGGVRRFRESFA